MPLPSADDELLLLHNPRCSKSRAALALIEERGIRVKVRLYLDEPLSLDELAVLRERLDRPAAEWTRTGEGAYREADLGDAPEDEALLGLMAEQPIVMERPILVGGSKAIVGRPTEALLPLLAS